MSFDKPKIRFRVFILPFLPWLANKLYFHPQLFIHITVRHDELSRYHCGWRVELMLRNIGILYLLIEEPQLGRGKLELLYKPFRLETQCSGSARTIVQNQRTTPTSCLSRSKNVRHQWICTAEVVDRTADVNYISFCPCHAVKQTSVWSLTMFSNCVSIFIRSPVSHRPSLRHGFRFWAPLILFSPRIPLMSWKFQQLPDGIAWSFDTTINTQQFFTRCQDL